MSTRIPASLAERAAQACELCRSADALEPYQPEPRRGAAPEDQALLCGTCRAQLSEGAELDIRHLYCLQEAAWSQVAAIQVISWRLLKRMGDEAWAQDLLGQLYMDEAVLQWARSSPAAEDADHPPTLDCHGATLANGDSVTIIKDLDVKGTAFVAKRGTTVKNIRLTDDPTHIEGRVNKVAIMLKTSFLKRL